jgi:hypothetical protein
MSLINQNAQPFDGENFNDVLGQTTPETITDPIPNFPAELKALPIWLVWKKEVRDGRMNKTPFNPTNGRRTNDSTQGLSFDVAVANLRGYDGLGIYIEDGLIAVDLDNCIVQGPEPIKPYAMEIVKKLNSYSEVSVSGKGIHVLIRGKKPGDICRRAGVELYSHGRFLAVTGHRLEGPSSLVEQRDISPIYDKYLVESAQSAPTAAPEKATTPRTTRNEIEHHHGGITDKLTLLMTGDFAENSIPFTLADENENNTITFDSQSEAIGALLACLAIKHDGDAEKMEAAFLTSALYRGISKWNEPNGKWARLGKSELEGAIKKYNATKPATAVSTTPVVEVLDNEEEIETDDSLPPFPKFAGLLHDLSEALSPDIPYAYKMASALTYAGIIRSGLDTLADERHVQPRLYTALIGQPGNGKTAAMNEVGKVMKTIASNYKSYSAIDSGPALVDSFNDLKRGELQGKDAGEVFHETPYRILLAPDEIKNIFDKSKADSGGKNSMLGEMLKLYEGNVTGSRVRGMKIKAHIETAHLAVLGGATEAGYASMWLGTAGASDGLQSRIIPVGLEPFIMPARQRPPYADSLATVIPKLMEFGKSPEHLFAVTDAAWALFSDWWGKKDQTDASVVRLDGVVKRVVILLAGTNEQQCVDEALMSQAISFADYIQFCRGRYNPADSLMLVQAMENLIVRCYEKHGHMTRNWCRRRTNADKKPGGMGPFLQAFKNLVMGEKLTPVEKSHKGDIYRLCR